MKIKSAKYFLRRINGVSLYCRVVIAKKNKATQIFNHRNVLPTKNSRTTVYIPRLVQSTYLPQLFYDGPPKISLLISTVRRCCSVSMKIPVCKYHGTGFNCENVLIVICKFLLCLQPLETQSYHLYM